jgi:succinate dehydrogenase/fumarate reductase flavoprotein subunit
VIAVAQDGGSDGKTVREYDVVVLGGGPVGINAADRAHAEGLSVALVERELVGGEGAGHRRFGRAARDGGSVTLGQARRFHPGSEFERLGQPLRTLRRSDQFADFRGVDRLATRAPAALGDLDDHDVQPHQP